MNDETYGPPEAAGAPEQTRPEYVTADPETVPGERRRQALAVVALEGPHGATWDDVARAYGWHHGQASGALSALHARGALAALADKRGRLTVYVLPEHVGDRATRHPGRNKPASAGALKEEYDRGYRDGWNALRDMQRGY